MTTNRSEAKFKLIILLILLAQCLSLLLIGIFFQWNLILTGTVIFIIDVILIVLLLLRHDKEKHDRIVDISKIIGNDANEAFTFGKIGLLTYDDSFMVTWMSDFFLSRDINFIGEKVTKWLPDINRIFQGDEDRIIAEYNDNYYEIIRKPDAQILFFLDITDQHLLQKDYDNQQVVLGLIHLDNYEEATQYQEETSISSIESQIKQPVIDWAIDHGMMIKRIKNDRFLVVLNESIYSRVVEERFSIMQTIQQTAQGYAIPITLSMAFARGTSDFRQLDEMLNSLLELAQSRGGDQVAMKKFGEDVKYFGGNREAQEKRSKVRVRVIAQTLRELIQQSHNVIIVGHKEMDFDCMGSALGLSRIVATYNKVVSIVCDPKDVESKLAQAMNRYHESIEERHHLISEEEAIGLLEDNTLVILVDHHNATQCNAPILLEKAKRIVVIDHHRRKSDFTFQPLMVYLESGASSVSELVTELFPYQLSSVNLTEQEATILYTGIVIDTTNFKTRTGSRTFEAAAQLRKYGADPLTANDLLKDSYFEFELKTSILKYCEQLDHNVIIAPYKGSRILSRAIVSQIANDILSIQDVEASFVIARIAENTVAVSARSIGNINVQVVLEQMSGGGHFTQAGLQRENSTVDEIKAELLTQLKAYFSVKEVEDESDSIS